ncbi:MAG: ribonuclease R [Cellulosilyticaceae bacterium]
MQSNESNELNNSALNEERKKKILDLLHAPTYKPMKIKEICILLQVHKDDRPILEELIGELIREGKIIRNKRGKFIEPAKLNFWTGTYVGHQKGFGFLVMEGEEKDLFIPASAVNGAMHKDTVMCRITKPQVGEKRAEGEVVKIIARGPQCIVGTYEQSQNFGFVVPDENKYSRDIFIPKKFNKNAVTGHKVLVEIIDWAEEKRNPEGKVISILGHMNDPGVDILSIIYQYDLPTEFPVEVMQQVDTIPAEISDRDKKGRTDMRHVQMVTIDGEDAKDLDDAISIERLDNGWHRLGVHIADVTHYVTDRSELDKEALERGTSIYLVDRVIPMLPHQLSNGICSLNAGVDRLALSCIMDIDPKGYVQSHQIHETVIKIDERMSYTNVKKILLNEDEDGSLKKRYADFIPMFEEMEILAARLRNKRSKRGAIDFDFPETKIILDRDGTPVEIKPYDRNVATKIIEEFMLVCNETIAEDYFWQEKPFLYRSHEDPDPEKIMALQELMNSFGYTIKMGAKTHPKDMQKVLEVIEDKPEENILSHLLLRSMKQARYTPECNGHFGLAAKYYSHFTSPIRRYPDLQIHRIIKMNLRGKLQGKNEENLFARMPEVATKSSLRERRAEEAERETIKLKKVQYMEQYQGEIFEGTIISTTSWGVYVELDNTVEGLVHVNEMDDDYYVYDEPAHRFVGKQTKKIYQLGERVMVRIIKTDRLTRTIDFRFVDEEDDYEELDY